MTFLLLWLLGSVLSYVYSVWHVWTRFQADPATARLISHGYRSRLILSSFTTALPTCWVNWWIYLLGPVGLLGLWLSRREYVQGGR